MYKYGILFLLLFAPVVYGQNQIAPKWMHYAKSEARATSFKTYIAAPSNSFLLRFPKGTSKAKLKKDHINVLRWLDSEHAIVQIQNEGQKVLGNTYYLTPARPIWKLATTLVLEDDSKKATYIVQTTNTKATIAAIQNTTSLVVQQAYNNVLYLEGNLAEIKEVLLPLEEVSYVGIESLIPIQESTVLDLNPSINNINKVYDKYPSLDGTGAVVSVKDNRFMEEDIDLIGKMVSSPLASETIDGHATDMSTIISGLGNSSIKGSGIARGVQIQSSDFNNLPPDGASFLSENAIYVQNHSYGTRIESFYGALAASYDTHIFENPEELHIFSSGNAGTATPEEGTYAGISSFANLTGNFKMAKNNLIIGAMGTEKNISTFSSKGPAYDGRIKPELVAYSIIGTSNATALTSGISALLQQAYTDQINERPTAALMKAALINSADDIGTPGPDFASGYGNINAFKAVESITSNTFINDAIGNGATRTYTIPLPANVSNFKATLVWTDRAATTNSATALVNDLDLTVVDRQGTTHLPWVLDASPSLISLETAASKGTDHLNNIEQVSVDSPLGTVIEIVVSGFDVVDVSQDFAIVYSWENANSFSWNYPISGDNFPYDGETASYFRWDTSFKGTTGNLAISYDNGVTWESIDDEIVIDDGLYLWPPPEEVTSEALLKMTIGNEEFISCLLYTSPSPRD